jgi:hypothetical protein
MIKSIDSASGTTRGAGLAFIFGKSAACLPGLHYWLCCPSSKLLRVLGVLKLQNS